MQERLLDYYKAIEAASKQMLEAARMEDWEGVVRCEGACAVPRTDRAEKTRVMQRILRNDAEIRLLAEPWIADLDHLFDSRLQLIH